MKHLLYVTAVCIFFAGCNNAAPSSDATPPRIYLLKWERNAQGTQGSQTTINSGSSFTIPVSWLGTGSATNKADIKIYADDKEGVSLLEVTGSAKGICSTDQDRNGQEFTSPQPLTASFPKQTEKTSPGVVKSFLAVHLDGFLFKGSCGIHRYGNMTASQEFFLPLGTWTITAHAENCCGGQTNATFTIMVQ